MKLGAVAENANAVRQTAGNKEKTETAAYRAGQIIEGTVTEAGDKVSIDFGGRTLSFSKESVPGASKGQVRRFQVMSADKKGITLKEIGMQAAGALGAGSAAMQVENSRLLAAYEEKEQSEQEEDAEAADRMTGEDYGELAAEGYTLEGFNLTRLARAIERIKAGRQLREEDVEGQQEKKKQYREDVRKMAEHSIKNQPLAEYLAELMVRADIPITQEKLDDIAKAVSYGAEAVQSLGDGAKAYLIGGGLTPDITNLYKAAHSGAGRQQKLSEEVWQELRPAAEGVLAQAGMEADEEGLAGARWLVEHDLSLTAENLVYKKELDALAENGGPELLLEKAVEAVSRGGQAAQAQLAAGPRQLWEETQGARYAEEFAQILPETVDAAAAQLRAEGKDGKTELSLNYLKYIQENGAGNMQNVPIADITARRQLEEIRFRLTAQAGARLLHQGIRLDTDGLERIVEGLRAIENEYYSNLYREVGADPEQTAEGAALLRRTDEAVTQLKAAPAYVLGVTFTSRNAQNLQGLSETGAELSAQFERAMERYEALMTKPRADMGDSIRTAFRNVDEVLSGMGLEATPENERAVRIMSYSRIELTEENLNEMKLYDAKVQELLRNMNPAACAGLIKKGVNPLDMPLDELNAELSALREEEGASTEEKYSDYLVMLDRSRELSASERESYIGIYRLLNQVAKSDGAAIGVVAASGRELTLSSLLSAVRTRKKGGMDASVDDAFGGVSAVSTQGKSISEQIGAAFGYERLMAGQAAEELTPEKLRALGGSGAALEMTAEELARALKETDNTQERADFFAAKAEALAQTVAESGGEQAFLSQFKQEKSVQTLRAARHILTGKSVRDRIQTLADKYGADGKMPEIDMEKAENAENLQNMVEEWADSADKIIDDVFESISLSGADSMLLLSLQGAVRLTRSLAKQEFYEIPVPAESGFVKMNLTVVHSGEGEGSVSIRLKGGEEVDISLRMEEKRLNGYISTASRGGLERMRQKEETIRQSLTEQGFEITQWNYGLRTGSADPAAARRGAAPAQTVQEKETGTGVTRTDDLYLAARTVIKTALER